MKIVTYCHNNDEKWGFVLDGADGEYVCSPQDVEDNIHQIRKPGSNFNLECTSFMPGGIWPKDVVSFLALEEPGMEILRKMKEFMQIYAWKQDAYGCSRYVLPINQVTLKAPIPRPRIYWGLVSNCPSFCRLNEKRDKFNLVPQGHNRPQSTACGMGETIIINDSNLQKTVDGINMGFNVELGIIIGKKGRNIKPEKAMDYVAGYTNVMDIAPTNYFNELDPKGITVEEKRSGKDFFIDATLSWGGKKMDCMAPMGPYLVTKDEIVNPYDLICYTKQNGLLRDRCWTGALMLGIERTIAYYSSFATLYPGDVLHMATMGIDGLTLSSDIEANADDTLEVEIENLGTLKMHICRPDKNDWREQNDPTKFGYCSPSVRDIVKAGKDSCAMFDLSETRSFYVCFGNYRTCREEENLIPIADMPRFLNNPVSALSTDRDIHVAPRMTDADIGLELALVIKKIAHKIREEDSEEYILGFSPMVVIRDHSLYEAVPKPATGQESGLTKDVYSRWGDGYNLLLDKPVFIKNALSQSLEMKLSVDGVGEITANTNDYLISPEKIISIISNHTTLTPNDVISLGRIGKVLPITAEQIAQGIAGHVQIETIGEFLFSYSKSSQ